MPSPTLWKYRDCHRLEIHLQYLLAPQGLEVCRMGLLFPVFSICYIVTPWWSFSQTMRKPFIKFICNSSSYFTFLCKSISQSIYNDNAPDTLSAHPTDSSTRQTSCPLLWRLILFIFCALPLSHYSFILVFYNRFLTPYFTVCVRAIHTFTWWTSHDSRA